MLVAGIYTITQNPSVFVTGCLHGIRKTFLCSPFRNHPLSGSVVLSLTVFLLFHQSRHHRRGIFGIFLLFFQRLFPCASRSSLISFFNCSSKNSASSSAIRFRIFCCLPVLLHGWHPRRPRKDRSVCIYSIPAGYGKRSVQKISILKASGIILSKRREMGNLVHHFQTEEPSVCDIDFDFFYCLAHTSDAVQILDEWNLMSMTGSMLGRPLSALYLSITRS